MSRRSIGSRVVTLKEKLLAGEGLGFAGVLSRREIEQACQESGYRWRTRIFAPWILIWAFLSQVLDADRSCRAAVSRVKAHLALDGQTCSKDTSGYCQARGRLLREVIVRLWHKQAAALEQAARKVGRWWGRPVVLADGSSVSMPDTPANQKRYPQPAAQKAGCGFPVARLVAFFSLTTGAVLSLATAALNTGEQRLFVRLLESLARGSIVVADRYFGSFVNLVLLCKRGCDGVFRGHQARNYDFRRGTILGVQDHLVTWRKPVNKPKWMSRKQFAALPAELVVREIRYQVAVPGWRPCEIVLVTTLLDAEVYQREQLAELYLLRWQAEVDLRQLKTNMGMEIVAGKSPEIVDKEIAMYLLAYNLIRRLMWEAGTRYGVPPLRLSLTGTIQHLRAFTPLILQSTRRRRTNLVAVLWETIAAEVLPYRPFRAEPRVKKRRPKNYPYMTLPRAAFKQRMGLTS